MVSSYTNDSRLYTVSSHIKDSWTRYQTTKRAIVRFSIMVYSDPWLSTVSQIGSESEG